MRNVRSLKVRRRHHADDLRSSVAGFWSWWASVGDQVAAAVESGAADQIEGELSAHVWDIDPGLAWELSTGESARHQLVVTAAGDPHLRSTARRWLQTSPLDDETWEFRDSRQPVAEIDGLMLVVADIAVSLDETLVGVHASHGQVDVRLYHPAMIDLVGDTRLEVCFLILDAALGEAAVETWIRHIEPSTTVPAGAMSLRTLRGVVTETAREVTEGEGAFSMLRGRTRRGPMLALVRQPVRPMVAPHLDTHVLVTVPYNTMNGSGMPTAQTLTDLQSLEDHLLRLVGGSGRLLVHETCAGERRIHIYVDGSTPAAAQIEAGVHGWETGRVRVKSQHDPAWDQVARFGQGIEPDDQASDTDDLY